jgi:K+-sensing histidine kinase KdpD
MMLKMRERGRLLGYVLDTTTGALLCAWLALTVALVRQTWPHPLLFLILFVPAVGVIARFWGFGGAMMGLVFSMVVFRMGLFAPLGRFEVASAYARVDLFWAVLAAGTTAYVFARRQHLRPDVRGGGGSC